MRILCFLSHPAQFYFYKQPILNLKKSGHEVFVLIKTKDILENLLDEAGWEYFNILPHGRGKSKVAIFMSLLVRDYRVLKFALKKRIRFFMGSDASLAHVAWLLHKPCISTTADDYQVIRYLADLTYPFTSHIVVPEVCSVGPWNRKKIGYNGFMKLSSLHPNYFQPDRSKVNVSNHRPYFLVRLSGLTAHHDFGIKGISQPVLDRIIQLLSGYGNVFITSEVKPACCYPELQLDIRYSDIHHYLYYAEMLISDSQSMSGEAAMLGTPSIRISDFAGRISVLEELEHKYGLTFGIRPSDEQGIFDKINELLAMPARKEEFQRRRQKMLADKIDVAAFMTWLVNDYPASVMVMKEMPEFQSKFK